MSLLNAALLRRFGICGLNATSASSLEQLIKSLCNLNPSLWSHQQLRVFAAHAQPQTFSPTCFRGDHASSGTGSTAHHQQQQGSSPIGLYGTDSWGPSKKEELYEEWTWRTPPPSLFKDTRSRGGTAGAGPWEDMQRPTAAAQNASSHSLAATVSPREATMQPPSPSSAPAQQPSHEQQLYNAYLELCAEHVPLHTLEDRQKHFGLFRQQLLAELRSGEQAAERFVKRQAARERFGHGQTLAQKHLRPLALEWMTSLQCLLEHELAKAKSALSSPHPSPAATEPAAKKGTLLPSSSNSSSSSSQLTLWPILAAVSTENVATSVVAGALQAIMPFIGQRDMHSPLGAQETDCWSVPSVILAEALGQRLEELVLHQQLREELLAEMRATKSKQGQYQKGQQRLAKMRRLAQNVEKRTGLGTGLSHQAVSSLLASISHVEHKRRWSRALRIQVGGELLHMLISASKLCTPEGRVVQGLRYEALMVVKNKEYKRVGSIFVHSIVPRMLLRDADRDLLGPSGSLLHDTRLFPMLVLPVPWTSFDSGGLIMHGPSAVRANKRDIFTRADQAGHMKQLYEGLNTLNALPWAVNIRVLEVMEALWSQLPGSRSLLAQACGTANSPATDSMRSREAASAFDISTVPAGLLLNLPTAWRAAAAPYPSADPQAVVAAAVPAIQSTPYLRSTRQGQGLGQLIFTAGPLTHLEARERKRSWERVKQVLNEKAALTSELYLKLQVARLMASHERFYIPHNIDFRGRAYPTSCYLHQLGDDTSRGLLLFAEAKPLGKTGLDWLFIQVAKCYGNGKDKLPFQGRHSFGKDSLPRVLASARAPLQPGDGQWWMEAEEPWQMLATCFEIAAALNSGDPESFCSRLPLQQDGTCNGLQHYAALARDYGGAFAVNLVPSPAPQDVYTAVSKVVGARVRKDAEQGVSEAMKFLARSNSVDRKLVKQTVMTSVYGVTMIGARQQIEARLEERGWDNSDEVYTVSTYLSKLTLSSIGELFKNAEAVMGWLAACASSVASTGKPVEWRSPLGFPISQPYYEAKLAQVDSSLQRFWVQKPTMTVAKRSQRTAFPPNYIHSLDSAHMMMTAMACRARGVAFAGVHDCFWTHAATADTMGTILRETFVQLHSRPLLEELVEDLKLVAPGITLPPIPPKGQLDLGLVRESSYFFS